MFNPIHALRPARISGQKFEALLRAFDPADFLFNKPVLARKILWEGELASTAARLLNNTFPFTRLYDLLAPEPEKTAPQYLIPELHGLAWALCAQSAVAGLCLGYNGAGAGASVNPLCFQSIVQDRSRRCAPRALPTTAAPLRTLCRASASRVPSTSGSIPTACTSTTSPTTLFTAGGACTASPACLRIAKS